MFFFNNSSASLFIYFSMYKVFYLQYEIIPCVLDFYNYFLAVISRIYFYADISNWSNLFFNKLFYDINYYRFIPYSWLFCLHTNDKCSSYLYFSFNNKWAVYKSRSAFFISFSYDFLIYYWRSSGITKYRCLKIFNYWLFWFYIRTKFFFKD